MERFFGYWKLVLIQIGRMNRHPFLDICSENVYFHVRPTLVLLVGLGRTLCSPNVGANLVFAQCRGEPCVRPLTETEIKPMSDCNGKP